MTVNDVKDFQSMFLITIPKTKNYVLRSFTVIGEFYKILKKYIELRPYNVDSNHLFLNYQNGKCTRQVIGVNKFGAMPKQIAKYLRLPDADAYTGRSFRRSSTALLADSGANKPINNKKITNNLITQPIILNSSASRPNTHNQLVPSNVKKMQNLVFISPNGDKLTLKLINNQRL